MAPTLMLTMNWIRSDASSLLFIPVCLYVTFWSRCSIFNYSSMECQGSSYTFVCYTKCIRKKPYCFQSVTSVGFSSSSIPLCLHLLLCDRYKFNEGNP